MSAQTLGPGFGSETSALFNPAFCSVLLHNACKGYSEKADAPMPITIAFLLLPTALHRPTREALPGTTATSMWSWLRENPVLVMDLPDRVRGFRPFTAAAITFGLRHAVLSGTHNGLAAGTVGRRPRTLHPTADWNSCLRAAKFLGKWFGVSDIDEANTLAHWGVQP